MKQLYANNAKTTLASPITASSTALVVSDGSKFPSPGANEYFLVTLEVNGSIEIIMVTARSGNNFTIAGFLEAGQTVPGRGQELTQAQSFIAGTKVECRVTKRTLDRMSKGLAAITSVDLMAPPSQSYQDGYVISTLDVFGNPLVSIAKDANTWRFLNATSQITATSTAVSTTTIQAASVPITDAAPGKYIIQFTSGANVGKLRSVTSVAANTVTWATAISGLTIGDTFEILKTNASLISDALANLSFPIADNTGSANAITASYLGTANALVDNLTVIVVLSTPNTVSNPTFAPNGLSPKTLKNNDGTALDVGQIKGAIIVRYEASTDDWRLVGSQQPTVVQPINYFLGNF